MALGICASPSLLRPILRENQKVPAVVVQGNRAPDGGAGLAAWKRLLPSDTRFCLLIVGIIHSSDRDNTMRLIAVVLMAIASGGAAAASFKGYQCSSDCSEHQVGYNWAYSKGLRKSAECPVVVWRQSFYEGCLAAVKEKASRSRRPKGP